MNPFGHFKMIQCNILLYLMNLRAWSNLLRLRRGRYCNVRRDTSGKLLESLFGTLKIGKQALTAVLWILA